MAFATVDYYKDSYYGADAADSEIEKWLSRATDDINTATLGNIDMLTISAAFKTLVRKATCAQAENYIMNGQGAEYTGLSVGAFSVSGMSGKTQGVLCDRAKQYLALTGLMNRCIGTVCRYPELY
jgi:hypothetical protein